MLTDSNQIFRNDFEFIIASVKFKLKLMSAKFFLPTISYNKLSITLSTLWCYAEHSFGLWNWQNYSTIYV